MIFADITTDMNGLITDTSTVTINGQTALVPPVSRDGWHFAPKRVADAVDSLGYRMIDNRTEIDTGRPDVVRIIVVPNRV